MARKGGQSSEIDKDTSEKWTKNDLLNSLLMIGINGTEQCSDDDNVIVQRSVDIWFNEKKRKTIKVPEESV